MYIFCVVVQNKHGKHQSQSRKTTGTLKFQVLSFLCEWMLIREASTEAALNVCIRLSKWVAQPESN